MEPSKVYFCDLHTHMGDGLPNKLKRLIKAAGIGQIDFENKFVAIKMHLGEPGNLSYLRPNYARAVVDVVRELGGKPFITDCNTLYVGGRKNALDHLDSAYANGFNPFQTGCHTIIADGLMDADVVISLTHFKGHEQAGFGGAMKNLGMGGGSRAGKMEQHAAGKPSVSQKRCIGCRQCEKICAHSAFSFDQTHEHEFANGKVREVHVASIDHSKCVGCGRCIAVCNQDAIRPDYNQAAEVLNYKIAEYTKAIVDGRPCFHISLAIDVSPNCDCHDENDKPIVGDIGFFASFDPVALDQACIDAVQAAAALPDTEYTHMRDKLEEAGELDEAHANDKFHITHPDTDWKSCIDHAETIGIGTHEYELIRVK